jgi:rubrerythrin
MATDTNLMAAFAGESQANRKYLAFAKKADAEGFAQIAKLFRAIAAAETVHALAHFRVAGHVKDTATNLAAARDGEHYEFTAMYPEFIEAAKAENAKAAVVSFERANAVEQVHHVLYSDALKSVGSGADLPAGDIYVCEVCGHTVIGNAPDVCPICGARHEKYARID